jgi:hypothetical protein
VAAVRSLLDQSEPVEVVVVHSDGPPLAPALERAGLAVEVVERRERLWPGAARNVGVVATRAGFVAFLAEDCLAEPGWAAARLAAHDAGAQAVASALMVHERWSACAWASYLSLFVRRMPGTPAADALRYGVSYTRELLAAVGPFREDLRVGEDSELNARVAARTEIAWTPAVRTAHRHPTRLAALLADQRARGARAAAALGALSGLSPRQVARNALARVRAALHLSWHHAEPDERRHVIRAWPLLLIAALAYAQGALTASRASGET